MAGRSVDPRFPERMRQLLDLRGLSYRALAARTFHAKTYLHDLATGRKAPTADVARRIDEALSAGGELAGMVQQPGPIDVDEGELARRVAASDISADTLDQLERAVDDLATAYAKTPPEQLLPRVREHLAFVGRLVDARKTLGQHRRLLVAGGWLALLGATVHIDLRQRSAAETGLSTARQLAEHAEHAEILAWVLETRAWDRLTAGDFPGARQLAQQAQIVAPVGSSAHIQATAQEGRAWARMGAAVETRDALTRTARLAAPLVPPDRPEHHYRYDPGKAIAYTATILSWVGDPAAEEFARTVVAQLDAAPDGVARPRRAAAARLDLALALTVAGKPDEACAVAVAALGSGRVVASNWWRVTEVQAAVEAAGVPEALMLREAAEVFRPVGK